MAVKTSSALILAVTMMVTAVSGVSAAEKKLQVFILAGQSNMVGHANYITIPRLFADDRAEVQSLAKLVFKPGATVTRKTVDAQIATRIQRDAINQKLRKKELAASPRWRRLARQWRRYPQTMTRRRSRLRKNSPFQNRFT